MLQGFPFVAPPRPVPPPTVSKGPFVRQKSKQKVKKKQETPKNAANMPISREFLPMVWPQGEVVVGNEQKSLLLLHTHFAKLAGCATA